METLEEAMAEAVALSDETLIEPINDILFVNPEERTIEIPETELLLGVYSDRNVERKYFKCPRIVGDNIDLSLCYMFINYVSSSGTIGQQQCNDVKLDETGNYITFSWLLSGNVFDKNIDNTVYFSVQAKMPNGENVFNTRKVSGDVYETVEAGEEITEEYADIILQIISRIDELEQGGGITQEQIEQALNKYLETNPIEVPTKLSDLQEDETHRTVTDVEKEQWNKAEENVQSDWNETDTTSDSFIKNKPSIPNKTSDLQNDSGFLTEHQDLSGYALKSEIPKYASDVGADASGTAVTKVSEHNTASNSHGDIRLLISGLIDRLNALADSDDETLDQMSEVVAYIKSNKSLIDAITTSKINVSDIIDNLTTNISNKPLSAAQGVKLKALIDAITTVELDDSLTDNTKAAPAGMVGELKGDIIHYAKVENGILYLYNDIEMTKEILHITLPTSSGGSSSDNNDNWELISNSDETMDSVSMLVLTTDNQGESFRLKKAVLFVWVKTGESYNYINFGFEKFSWITSISGKSTGYMYRILMEKDVDGEWMVRTSRAIFDRTTFLPTENFSSEVIGKIKRYLSDFIEGVFFETGSNSSYAKYALYGIRE